MLQKLYTNNLIWKLESFPPNVESDSIVLTAAPGPISSPNRQVIILQCLCWFSMISCCLVAAFKILKRGFGKINLDQIPGSHKNNLDNKFLNMKMFVSSTEFKFFYMCL